MFTHFLLKVLFLLGSIWGLNEVVITTSESTSYIPYTTSTAYVIHIVDGDTIDVQIGTSTNSTRVRYIGINTPEPYPKNNSTAECGSHEATSANSSLVKGQTVTLVTDADPFDPYGRLLAYVYVGNVFINEELVRHGFATTLSIKPNTRYKSLFMKLRDEAKTNHVGNWQICPHWH